MKSKLAHMFSILKEMYSLPTLSLRIFSENKAVLTHEKHKPYLTKDESSS